MIMPKFTPQIILINIAVALHITVFTWLVLNYLPNERVHTVCTETNCIQINSDFTCVRVHDAEGYSNIWWKLEDDHIVSNIKCDDLSDR